MIYNKAAIPIAPYIVIVLSPGIIQTRTDNSLSYIPPFFAFNELG